MATDVEIRKAMRNLIAGIYPAAKSYHWNALTHDIDEWPGLFKISSGFHGWIIKRASLSAEWKGNGNRDRQLIAYDILGFYGPYRTGAIASNSDDEFSVIVDAVYAAFKASPKLELSCIDEHGLIQWKRISTINCGEQVLHIAIGQITVSHCC